jgi:Cdc6-like AAA superfamily ATPase
VLIVESRIGCTVVDPKVVAYVASKVSATSGDARKCLSLVAKAIELCREKGPPAFLESIVLGPVVKMPHAMMAIRESNIRITDVIDALPAYQKYLLVVGVHLSRECRKTKPIQFGELKKRALAAFGFLPNLDSVITLEDFRGIMEKLVDAGLLKVDGFDYSTPIGVLLTREVHFDLQLEDVESALEQTVLQEPFYKGMLHRLNSKPQHDR